MILHVVKAKYLHDYVIWVRFNDGVEGEIDLEDALVGTVFEPLKNIDVFKSFKISRSFKTIFWDNGADFAPEFLHEKIKVKAEALSY